MIINIIGNCDKRPVLYTVMKICQTLGDVLVITNNARLLRLSDTRDSFGHYQNTMIAYTQEGIDDFLDDFNYDFNDFEYTIVDNIVLAEANLTIYVEGLLKDESEMDLLEYIESYQTIELYKGNLLGPKTLRNLECFEAFANMQPISAKLAERVSVLLGEALDKDPKMLQEIAMQEDPSPDTSGKRQVGPGKRGKLLAKFGKK